MLLIVMLVLLVLACLAMARKVSWFPFVAVLILSMIGGASAAEPLACDDLADLASKIADQRNATMPEPWVASSLRAQARYDTEEARNYMAMVERMIPAVYKLKGTPDATRHTIYLKCVAGEFAPKRAVPGSARHGS
jgi:hypothetical protein